MAKTRNSHMHPVCLFWKILHKIMKSCKSWLYQKFKDNIFLFLYINVLKSCWHLVIILSKFAHASKHYFPHSLLWNLDIQIILRHTLELNFVCFTFYETNSTIYDVKHSFVIKICVIHYVLFVLQSAISAKKIRKKGYFHKKKTQLTQESKLKI